MQNSLIEEGVKKAADKSYQKLIQSVSPEAKTTAQKYYSQVNKVVFSEGTG